MLRVLHGTLLTLLYSKHKAYAAHKVKRHRHKPPVCTLELREISNYIPLWTTVIMRVQCFFCLLIVGESDKLNEKQNKEKEIIKFWSFQAIGAMHHGTDARQEDNPTHVYVNYKR